MATRGPFGRDLSDMFSYSDAVRKALKDILIILPQPLSRNNEAAERNFYVNTHSFVI